MATCDDSRGLPVTAADSEAVAHYDRTVAAYLRFGKDTGQHLKAALEADPALVMGHCLKGYFFQLFCNPALTERARKSLATAREAADEITRRESAHLDALAHWVDGRFTAALGLWESILLEHPRDILALKLAHYLHFYLGDAGGLRDSVARVLHGWDEDTPGFPYVLGMHAFGLEESGDYPAAEQTGRDAVELEPDDSWATHAVAHVLEMQDRRREGVAWLRDLEAHWSACNNFAYHLWWHLALFHLELDEHEEVLGLYDAQVRSDRSDEYLDICNATSLLWRLEERGVDVGDRWAELGERCEGRVEETLMVFPDCHYALALGATGRDAAMARLLGSMEAAGNEATTEAGVYRELGVALARAIEAWYRDAHATVIEHLLPIRHAMSRIGGSHAQRDLFHQMLTAAALRSDDTALARTLLDERVHAKPDNPWTWRRYGDALAAVGDDPGAASASERAAALL